MPYREHIIVACLVAAIVTLGYFAQHTLPSQEAPGQRQETENYRIAILQPVTHAALDEIRQGFIEEFTKYSPTSTYKIFNANGNRTLMTAQANEIIQGNYDLVLSIATQPTIILRELCVSNNCATPIIGAAVNDPVENNLIASLEKSATTIAVVIETDDIQQQLQLLQWLAPSVHNILLVYNPNPTTLAMHKKINTYCQEHGLRVDDVAITTTHEIYNKVAPLIHGHDCVLVLKDNIVVAGIDALITLCNKEHIMLYVSDLNSGQKGASIAYGVQEATFGKEAAVLAKKILIDHQNIAELPSKIVDQYIVQLNKPAIVAQQAPIDPNLLQLLSNTRIIA